MSEGTDSYTDTLEGSNDRSFDHIFNLNQALNTVYAPSAGVLTYSTERQGSQAVNAQFIHGINQEICHYIVSPGGA